MQTSDGRTLPLDYQTRQSARGIDNSRLVRLLALVTVLALLVLIAHFLQRSRETLAGLSDWVLPIGAAFAGAIYCTLISLNVAGRTKAGSFSSLRRIGGIGAPVLLVLIASRWIQDVAVDPYAQRYDVVIWRAAAAGLFFAATFIAYLSYLHWNDTNEIPQERPISR